MFAKLTSSAIALLLILAPGLVTAVEPKLELKAGDVVALIGGASVLELARSGWFEAQLLLDHREAKPKFRYLAWEGDTVYFQSTVHTRWRKEAFGDWDAQLRKIGATVVIAQFGEMESFDGEERVDEFKQAYGKLIDALSANGRRVALLEPEIPSLMRGPPYRWAVLELANERKLAIGRNRPELGAATPGPTLIAAIREKNRLWDEFWRPSNWKCLFGDDSKRVFSNAAEGLPSFKDEWSTYPALIARADEAIVESLTKQIELKARVAPPRTGSPEADIAAELAAFELLDGYQVNLFADESHGIANPLSLRWDPDGRMFVACSDVYPQIEPGVKPDDKIFVLNDTDGDGKADESEIFARGLNIPTGMEVWADAVYVGQGVELLRLGFDGERRAVLSGFGNGDSHQTINSFVWGPGGDLWFCQGDGIESRVETPFGVSSLYQAGVFRLAPRELKLDGLLDDFMGPGNPWGVAFDDYGQSFVVDGAGGISFLTPASIPAKRRLKLPRIGKPGGYCGVECLGGDTFVIGDYKKNQVSCFKTVEDGAGFKVEFTAPLLRSKHRNFRPIDVKLGPDGAIYVVDWYNPITCHQDDFYRHPKRDKTHGRIWRVSKRGGALKSPARLLSKMETGELVALLKSDKRWLRLKAKQVLAMRKLEKAPVEVYGWEGRDLLEALAMMEWASVADLIRSGPVPGRDLALLKRASASPDYRVRAYAVRVAGKWDQFELLQVAADDPHPRVRMEALLACGQIPEARSVLIAAAVAQHPRDRWIDYAFKQAVHHLKPQWLPAFTRGELDFGDLQRGLAAVLGEADSKDLLGELRAMLDDGDAVKREARVALNKSLIAIGDEQDLQRALQLDPPDAAVLRALAERARPSFEHAAELRRILGAGDPGVRVAAMSLIARWRVDLKAEILEVAGRPAADPALRSQALRALGALGGEEAVAVLKAISKRRSDAHQGAAIAALAQIDLREAAAVAGLQLWHHPLLGQKGDGEIWRGFALREGGGKALAEALGKHQFSKKHSDSLHASWIRTGLVDAAISKQLEAMAGLGGGGRELDDALIKAMVAAGKKGDRTHGETIFGSARVACSSCHKVGARGGVLGPDLSALGSGVSPERIVTEVLWPGKQVKEGYSLTRVKLKDGVVLQGYQQKNRDDAILLLRDFATAEMHELKKGDIEAKQAIGSLMPATAQGLSERELADLFAYLFSLGG